MIAANVAAAKALEAKKAPVMYRVHEPPSREKLVALKDYLEDVRHRVRARPGDQARRPSTASSSGSARPTARAADHGADPAHPDAGLLRARSNHGHFGLALGYLRPFHLADPALCRPARPSRAGRAPTGSARAGCSRPTRPPRWSVIGELISQLERRAMEAERETIDRYVAAFLSDQVGAAGRMPDHRRAAVRLLRRRSRSWAATGWCRRRRSAGNISATTRRPEPGRRGKRRELHARPAADAAARRGQSGQRRPALRAAGRSQRRPARRRPPPPGPPGPSGQYPPPGKATALSGGFEAGPFGSKIGPRRAR